MLYSPLYIVVDYPKHICIHFFYDNKNNKIFIFIIVKGNMNVVYFYYK